ncbi:galactose mutarotase-like domain-containing protein [Microdochium bolleyi]|uniref:Galactose mutarotase-like domain-containing protein n=1 Tax=Microdochium bolleyi TaxID=196109 RepID=A0A136JIP1_9PEZI|nr:galactose mutarotase-like domain-containing protein [Microdochium bolleyi]
MRLSPPSLSLAVVALATTASALLNATETAIQYILQNDRLYVAVNKNNGQVIDLSLDSQDLLGPVSGSTGKGPYLDCSCTPSGAWTPGSSPARRFQLIEGVDSTGTAYGGIIMGDTFAATNQSLYQYWFLRDGETGLHTFSRLTYFNESRPLLRDLGELRTLFRPNPDHGLWTHLSSSTGNSAPLPGKQAFAEATTVQDATTYLGRTTSDGYVAEYADFFTKYTFSELWRDHDVHGQFADGSGTAANPDGSTYGAWLVHNTRETYYGGPLHSDLVVDGIVYNYMVAGHHGAPVPNITHGFDRTWGPQYFHFNKGAPGTTLAQLRADAARYADPEWDAEFYDSIARHVPNYAPSSARTTFRAHVELPKGARRPIAVLSENGQDFQLNVFRAESLQYWADINMATGMVKIPRVREGTYRLTVFADGVFGWFIQDDVVVAVPNGDAGAGSYPEVRRYTWSEESAGREVWRIGTPDKSAGEYRHGYALDESKPLQPEQYRIYWARWDFPTDFPDGVNFHVGQSDAAMDWNYIHWSVYPGQANFIRPGPPKYYTNNINNWTVTFDLTEADLAGAKTATLTVQLAGTKTANGNNKWAGQLPGEKYSNLPYTVALNNGTGDLEQTWVIPYWRSGSCGVRSSVVCQNTEHKFVFDVASALQAGRNKLVLSLPFNATNKETALLPDALYVQYDALRFELA